jgi:TPR repeat protein
LSLQICRESRQETAEQDQHEAQAELATLYESGRGVPRDLNRACLWRLLSLDRTNPKQSDQLRNLARQMTDDDIADAVRRASKLRAEHQSMRAREVELSSIANPNLDGP